MATCPQCSTQKAKRECPALAQTICPVCCAELRMIELACPESCPYLKEARKSTAQRRMPKFVQYLAANDKREALEVINRFEMILFLVERAIVEVQRYRFRDLSDEEALEGVKNALKTYETLDRGIIYEHPSESPRVQAVTRAALDALNDVKKRLQEQQQSSLVKTQDYVACLKLVIEGIQFDIQSSKDRQAWFRYMTLYQPYPPQETQRLIVTG
jgi:hypothetical protein